MKIGIDAMGGDFAPEATVMGAIKAYDNLPSESEIVLIGDSNAIKTILEREKCNTPKIKIVHSDQVIEMGDHPAKAFANKTNSSISIGFGLLKQGEIDSFASAGNTGAMMVGTLYSVKTVPGILRPCITGPLTKLAGDAPATVLDVGLNSDCKPDVLYQYAILGSMYAKYVYKIGEPRVALLNIGEEEEKGNLLTKATYELMKDSKDFNFIGNIESGQLYFDNADVIVCDGFTGNIILKQAEALYTLAQKLNIDHDFYKNYNYENQGGTAVLGVNAPVLIGHGISSAKAIETLIYKSRDIVESGITEKIKQAFK